ncbi:putative Zn-dependent protease DUF2268 [Mucilaginibacter oryzae]|uniref:Putative Zn-dependent protease DUF2268 n=1 Tax=Mucilaginibacter oryzae TaxID=468058 RepID=A0A316HAT5_9SPHI|nr:DUF2268 domain-containing putative Zn-dependent protease [Mucilaginibacter oryzae]PWK77507.1 putative Zn-dependent protease DUF2268 [Mucilaginibacter oryzae]
MIKRILLVFGTVCLVMASSLAQQKSLIETSDIDLFWEVYDKVIAIPDSVTAVQLIQHEYIDKGSEALSAIKNFNFFESRDLYKLIKDKHEYLNSIRKATLSVKADSAKYLAIFDNFKKTYNNYSYPKIRFTMGAMLIGGFNKGDNSIVIGTEIATGTRKSKIESLNPYFKMIVSDNQSIEFLVAHELAHTQQNPGYLENMNLLSLCLMEGSADFIADFLLNRKNTMPYTIYGRKHAKTLKKLFIEHIQSDNQSDKQFIFNNWLYNAKLFISGAISTRPDLGYYIGYEICKSYYRQAGNKKKAIADILNINYDDKNSVTKFYGKSGFAKD